MIFLGLFLLATAAFPVGFCFLVVWVLGSAFLGVGVGVEVVEVIVVVEVFVVAAVALLAALVTVVVGGVSTGLGVLVILRFL